MTSRRLLDFSGGSIESKNDSMTPSLGLLLAFWLATNVLVILWSRCEISDAYLPGSWRVLGVVFYAAVALAPLAILFLVRGRFLNPVMLGLLVSCCLAISVASNESNQLRAQMQFSLDHEREFAHLDLVEGIIRPLISKIVETYVGILGDDKTGGSTARTHVAINYMFDSASFLAVFALGTRLLSPAATWLCLFTIAFFAQTSIFAGRMGALFLAGGFFWQLFLLVSRRYPVAVISGLIISFLRTDVVFATAFAILSLAWIEKRWPSLKEWSVFAVLIVISLVVPKTLIALHPTANFNSFLITHGEYFTKAIGNLMSLKLAVALASPVLVIVIVTTSRISRTVAAVGPPALIYLGIVFLIADFSETRLLGPALGALAFVGSEGLASLLGSAAMGRAADGTGREASLSE